MPRTCTICNSKKRNDIDRDLIGTDSLRAIAGRYRVAASSLDRHRRKCLAPKVAAAFARHDVVTGDKLMAYTSGVLEHAMLGMLRSRQNDDDASHRAYMGETRKAIELQARLAHVIGATPIVQVDARKQVAVLANLTEGELRALARGDVDVIEGTAREAIEA
jgi:hypothetical protein